MYLVTFAASMTAYALIRPALDPAYVVGPDQDVRVLAGCLLDVVNALACIGTAVAVLPVVRRINESLAVGFVMSRMFEAAVIMVGVVSLLAVVTLRQESHSDGEGITTSAQALIAVRDWSFLLGPGLVPALNALLFATLLYRSGFVPRVIPAMGLVGAPLLLVAATLTFFGANSQDSVWSALLALPIAAWELSVGVYMLVKGFRSPADGRTPT